MTEVVYITCKNCNEKIKYDGILWSNNKMHFCSKECLIRYAYQNKEEK